MVDDQSWLSKPAFKTDNVRALAEIESLNAVLAHLAIKGLAGNGGAETILALALYFECGETVPTKSDSAPLTSKHTATFSSALAVAP